ncbi:MAG TPA: aldolase, partial [Gemmatimonadaceae bacterium]|nr:aldolase [Gemmatimonadaceae bacterium]
MLANPFKNAVTVLDGKVTVHDEGAIATAAMDKLAYTAVFGDQDDRDDARWLIWEIGQSVGVRAASIHDLYLARGRGKCGGFTVPAMNIRGMAYDTGRAVFRQAVKLKVGALILEIARSEIAYTDQRPTEYVSVMLAAALREGFRGPVFIQGDHFQVNAKKFAADPVTEVNGVKALIREAVAAGFYNIDVDTSTLVDLAKPNLNEQQRANYETGVELTLAVRDQEPEGITISIGG